MQIDKPAITKLDTTSNGAVTTTSSNGTIAILAIGTAASNLVQLDGSAKLPAVDGSQLTGIVSGASMWTTIVADNYTATPASTSTITMLADVTATVLVGSPLRYMIGGVEYFGQVTALTANLMTIRGAPLGGSVSGLKWGDSSRLLLRSYRVAGAFADATNTALLASDCYEPAIPWKFPKGYCIGFDFAEKSVDSGANQPNVNVTWGGNAISTANTNAGPLLSDTPASTVVDINTTNYVVDFGEAPELKVVAGSSGNAMDLAVDIWMVIP